MSVVEAIVVAVALIVAGAVSILHGSIEPVLAGLLGTAIGYGAKGAVTSVQEEKRFVTPGPSDNRHEWKGAPDA